MRINYSFLEILKDIQKSSDMQLLVINVFQKYFISRKYNNYTIWK